MTTDKRLKDAQAGLSAKQIVLLMIKEAHAHGSARRAAQRMVREEESGVCERIEAAFNLRAKANSPRWSKWASRSASETDLIREAQREGMFLWGVAMACNEALLTGREAMDLRWLCWNQSMLLLTEWSKNKQDGATGPPDEPPLTLEYVMQQMRQLRLDLTTHQGAISLIERTYFGEQAVLFSDLREWLDRRTAGVVDLLEHFDRVAASKSAQDWEAVLDLDREDVEKLLGLLREPAPEEGAKRTTRAASGLARRWIQLVRAQVHDKMGERGAAAGCLAELMEGI